MSALAAVAALGAAALLSPSTNLPTTGATGGDRLEVDISAGAERVDVHLGLFGQGTTGDVARAQLSIYVEGSVDLVEIRSVSGRFGVIEDCSIGTGAFLPNPIILNGDGAEMREYTAVDVREHINPLVICFLTIERFLDVDGALTVVTLPTLQARVDQAEAASSICVERWVAGIPFVTVETRDECRTVVSASSDGTSTFVEVPSATIYGESPAERSNQDRLTLFFGILIGIGGGFVSHVAAWADRRWRNRRRTRSKRPRRIEALLRRRGMR